MTTKRERAIEAAAKAGYVRDATERYGLSQAAAEDIWANQNTTGWRDARIESTAAAITEYERVMAEPDEGAQ